MMRVAGFGLHLRQRPVQAENLRTPRLQGTEILIQPGLVARLAVILVVVNVPSPPSVRYGNALIKLNLIGGWFYITDSNSLNNLSSGPMN
jgi:hypothetical protein